jgi:hypothetical protein
MKKILLNVLFILLICTATIFLCVKIYEYTTGLTISEQGSTGDAFNGFVAPFIGVFSGILVYLAFREQVKANILLSSNIQLETFTKLLAQIKDQVEGLEFTDIWHEKVANDQVKDSYEYNKEWYTKKFKGSAAMVAFSHHLKRKDGAVSWYQKEFLKSLMLIYEDIILLERFIDSSRGENSKYFYLKLNFLFELTFETSFKIIYEKLKDQKGEFYYMTIHNMERVRFVLSTYQLLEQKIFIKQQEDVELKRQVQKDLAAITDKKNQMHINKTS